MHNDAQININKNIIIDGQGHTINFNQQIDSSINIDNGVTLTLKNIILINSYEEDDTGVISNNGALIITNATFTNNTADSGGVIINNGNLSINGSNFTGNAVDYDGGVILNNGNLSINGSNFADNAALYYGGVISNTGNLSILNSTFNSNRAYSVDGEDNFQGEGGAIYNSGSLTIIDSIFIGNNALNGGAISNNEGNLSILNVTFTNNNAYDGGVINNPNGNLTIIDSIFMENYGCNGGVINNPNGNFSIIDSNFIGNTANCGGVIYNEGGNFSILNSTFNNNYAFPAYEPNSQGEGGVIYNEGGNFSINASIFTDNFANSYGVIYNSEGNFSILNSTFNNNRAYSTNEDGNLQGSGGVIYTINGNFTIFKSIFNNNSAGYGGVIYNSEGNFSILESTFNSNRAYDLDGEGNPQGEGGVIYNPDGNFSIFKSIFTNNTAASTGGVIYNSEGNFSILESTFNSNRAYSVYELDEEDYSQGSGGVIYNEGGNFSINTSIFTGNTANYGGVIHNNANLTIIDSIFTNNSVNSDGGVINNQEGTLSILNSTFNSNRAYFVDEDGYPQGSGGVIYNSNGILDIFKSIFNNNKACYGGVINNPDGKFSINDSSFIGNTVDYDGGVIYTEYNEFNELNNIFNSTFKNNKAYSVDEYGEPQGSGGVIYNTGTLNINQSILADNIGDYTIYNDEESGIINAESNYWGNKNPTSNHLVNFVVNNYWRFTLGDNIITDKNTNVSLSLNFNSTNSEHIWSGPEINTGNITFTVNSKEASLTQTNNTVVLSASNIGNYLVTATATGIKATVYVVIKGPTTIKVTMPSTTFYGATFKIILTLKVGTTPITGQTIKVLYKGKTYKTGTTNHQGTATIAMPKLKYGTYYFTIQYNGNTYYQKITPITKKITITPLKITKTTPRNGQKRYKTKTIVITFNQNIKIYSKKYYSKIYVKNLKTKKKILITKKIKGNKLYITMKTRRTSRTYYQIYIPRYSIVNTYRTTITKTRTIKFRT